MTNNHSNPISTDTAEAINPEAAEAASRATIVALDSVCVTFSESSSEHSQALNTQWLSRAKLDNGEYLYCGFDCEYTQDDILTLNENISGLVYADYPPLEFSLWVRLPDGYQILTR
jgi:hypothetical protein